MTRDHTRQPRKSQRAPPAPWEINLLLDRTQEKLLKLSSDLSLPARCRAKIRRIEGQLMAMLIRIGRR